MAGQIIVSSIKTDSDNSISFLANTGATIFSANLASGLSASSFGNNTITSDKIVSVANTKISGNIVSSQITSVANTQLTGTVTNAQVGSSVYEGIGFRNRIINGDMRIDQRNAGASVSISTTSDVYTLDRWAAAGQTTDGVFSVQRSTTAPSGFTNSMLVTVTTADASIGSTQYYLMQQSVEGFNVADLGWGTASAKTVTLSFWVRSSVTGTFGGSIRGSFTTSTRSYPFTYTINSANTYEYKTVTIAGDTSGTWATDNGAGLRLTFSIGDGSSRVGTAGSWATANYSGATGQTNLIETSGATWYITGVQLEVGSVATPFERRPYGTELFLCQRYYWVYTSNNSYIGILQAYSTTEVFGVLVNIPVPMRATPSVSQSGNFSAYRANSDSAGMSTTIAGLGTNGQNIETTGWGGGSGLVAGHAVVFQGSTGAKLIASAEL